MSPSALRSRDRPDLLPDAYGRSLKVLQTEVPPKPFRVIKGIVERELGCALGDAFATFDEAPLGSASIGQVHRATLAARRDVAEDFSRLNERSAFHSYALDFHSRVPAEGIDLLLCARL